MLLGLSGASSARATWSATDAQLAKSPVLENEGRRGELALLPFSSIFYPGLVSTDVDVHRAMVRTSMHFIPEDLLDRASSNR